MKTASLVLFILVLFAIYLNSQGKLKKIKDILQAPSGSASAGSSVGGGVGISGGLPYPSSNDAFNPFGGGITIKPTITGRIGR